MKDASQSSMSLWHTQVERANGMILDVLKKHLYEKEQKLLGKWLMELLAVV